MSKTIIKEETVEIEFELSDFSTNDIIMYLEDEASLTEENLEDLFMLSKPEEAKVLHPTNLNDVQKVEMFLERYENIPIAEFLEFFNRYK